MSKTFRLIPNALVMPLNGTMDKFTAGVFQSDSATGRAVCVEDSLMDRGSAADPLLPECFLEGAAIFGGYLFLHYGHFLLESLSRVYAIMQCKQDLPVLFASPNEKLSLWQQNIFKALGMHNPCVLVKTPMRVDSLIVSPVGCRIPNFLLPEQVVALGKVHIASPTRAEKIWLSRSHHHGGGVLNEAEIETELEKMGWTIIHPQDYVLVEQIRLISTARHVAGFDGSAFYTALLAEEVHGHFCIFGRRNFIEDALVYMLAMKGIQAALHILPVRYESGKGAMARFVMDDIRPLLDVLQAF